MSRAGGCVVHHSKIGSPRPEVGQNRKNSGRACRVCFSSETGQGAGPTSRRSGSVLIGNPGSNPQPHKSTSAAKQHRRVREGAFTPKPRNQPSDRRANQDCYPNRQPRSHAFPWIDVRSPIARATLAGRSRRLQCAKCNATAACKFSSLLPKAFVRRVNHRMLTWVRTA
jgi:hypothetical protein